MKSAIDMRSLSFVTTVEDAKRALMSANVTGGRRSVTRRINGVLVVTARRASASVAFGTMTPMSWS